MSMKELGGLLSDVALWIEEEEQADCLVARLGIKRKEIDTDELTEKMRREHPGKTYEEWVDIAYPAEMKQATIHYAADPLLYKGRGINEKLFKKFCRDVVDTITSYEQDGVLIHRLDFVDKVLRDTEQQKGLVYLKPVYDEVRRTRTSLDLPLFEKLEPYMVPELRRRVAREREHLASGKIVTISDPSFFSHVSKDGCLLFEPSTFYVTCLRDSLREELKAYLASN